MRGSLAVCSISVLIHFANIALSTADSLLNLERQGAWLKVFLNIGADLF